jgi:hypothetical protein
LLSGSEIILLSIILVGREEPGDGVEVDSVRIEEVLRVSGLVKGLHA